MTRYQEVIVKEAREWLGTRFHHQGRLRKNLADSGGCDCLGLLLGVAGSLDLRSPRTGVLLTVLDRKDYGHHPDEYGLRKELEAQLLPVSEHEKAPGDIGLFAIGGRTRHLGILSDYPDGTLGLIHAYAPARRVVEHRLDGLWEERLAAVFRVGECFSKSLSTGNGQG